MSHQHPRMSLSIKTLMRARNSTLRGQGRVRPEMGQVAGKCRHGKAAPHSTGRCMAPRNLARYRGSRPQPCSSLENVHARLAILAR